MPSPEDASLTTALVNLTPHDVVILNDHGRLVVPPVPLPARVTGQRYVVDQLDTGEGLPIEIVTDEPGPVVGLPAPMPGTLFLVSRLVAERCPHRLDLLYPVDLVRDDAGTVIACKRLARVAATALGSAHPDCGVPLPTDA